MKHRGQIGSVIVRGLVVGLLAVLGCSGLFGRGASEGRAPDQPPAATSDGSPRDVTACDAADLVWRTGRKTNYTSYPEPGSEECIVYSGCKYEGLFAACSGKKPVSWVKSHNIAAFFPDFGSVRLHDLCIRAGNKTMVVTIYDTCGDGDCNGCCSRNRGSADALIDLESYTNARFGVADGPIRWADLGPTRSSGCGGPAR